MSTEKINGEDLKLAEDLDISEEKLLKDGSAMDGEIANLKMSSMFIDKRVQQIQLKALRCSRDQLLSEPDVRPEYFENWASVIKSGETKPDNIEATRKALLGSGFRPIFLESLGVIARCCLLENFRAAKQAPKALPQRLPNSPQHYKEQVDADSLVVDFALPGIKRNLLTHEIVYTRDDGSDVVIQGGSLNTIHLLIAELIEGSIPKDRAKDQVIFKADQNPWNPGRDFIQECQRHHSLTVQEAKQIVFSIASTYLHNDEELPNRVLGLWLIAHALNTFDMPNSQAPEYLPILAGEQGCYKSSFLRILFGGHTGERSLTSVVSTDPAAFFKDVTLVSTAWFMEFPEIERWLTKTHLNAFKGRVTDPFPEGRRPYDPLPSKFKRLSAWAGTTNNPLGILIDRSSAYDRRFIPIQIPAGTFIETKKLEEDLTKLWAAVMVCVEHGIAPNPHSLPADLYKDLAQYQEPFAEESPLQETLLAYARGNNEVNTLEALRCCFGLTAIAVTDEQFKEAKAIYRKYLTVQGFTSKKKRLKGRQTWIYVRDVQLTSEEINENRKEVNRNRANIIRFDPLPSDKDGDNLDF